MTRARMAAFLAIAAMLHGCISAPADPPEALDIEVDGHRVHDDPGGGAGDWDEYVLSIRNEAGAAVVITGVTLLATTGEAQQRAQGERGPDLGAGAISLLPGGGPGSLLALAPGLLGAAILEYRKTPLQAAFSRQTEFPVGIADAKRIEVRATFRHAAPPGSLQVDYLVDRQGRRTTRVVIPPAVATRLSGPSR